MHASVWDAWHKFTCTVPHTASQAILSGILARAGTPALLAENRLSAIEGLIISDMAWAHEEVVFYANENFINPQFREF